MKILQNARSTFRGMKEWGTEAGKIGYALAWMLGIPLPVLVIVYLFRGCE
jgi:hypothetical protein